MKRIHKLAALMLAVSAVLVALVTAALVLAPESDLVRRSVEKQIEAASGHSVRVGSLRVGFAASSVVGLFVEGLVISSKTGETLLSVNEITLYPRLFPLLKKRIVIRAAAVNGFQCVVLRTADGKLVHPFTGGQSDPLVERTPVQAPGAHQDTLPPPQRSSPASAHHDSSNEGGAPDWSIAKTSLHNGTVTWRDDSAGRQVSWSAQRISGEIRQSGDQPEFTVNMDAKIGVNSDRNNRFTLKGTVLFSSGFRVIERLEASLAAEEPDIDSLRPYLGSHAAALTPVCLERIKVDLRATKESTPASTFEASLRLKDAQGSALLRGDFTPVQDMSAIQSLHCVAELQSIPLSPVRSLIPATGPLDIPAGFCSGTLEGKWVDGGEWGVDTRLTVNDIGVLTESKSLPHRASLRIEAQAGPKEITIVKMQTLDPAGLISIEGQVKDPGAMAAVDLKAHIAFPKTYLGAFGISIGDHLKGGAAIPAEITFRGPLERLHTTCSADLHAFGLTLPPYFEKPAGAKASFVAEGVLEMGVGMRAGASPSLSLTGTASVSGAAVKGAPHGKWISPINAMLRAKIIHQEGKTDLKDGSFRVAEMKSDRDILKARFSVGGATSTRPAIDASADLTIDQAVLDAAIAEPQPNGFSLKGSSVISAYLKGSSKRGTWRISAPLDGLDLTLGKAFRKPPAVKGTFSASGTISSGSIVPEKADLNLSGLALSARDAILDEKGGFREAKLALSKMNIETLEKFIPSIKGWGLHGALVGRGTLTKSGADSQIAGTLELRDWTLGPEKAQWGVEAMHGEIVFKNDSIRVESIEGRLAGGLQGPLKVTAALTNLANPAALSGSAALEVGKGGVKQELVSLVLSRAGIPAEKILSVLTGHEAKTLIAFDLMKGDFKAENGLVSTENLRLRGKDLNVGVTGRVRVPAGDVDGLLGLRSVMRIGEVAARIPGLPDILRRNRGLIKATGVEKELERMGIKLPGGDTVASPGTSPAGTPLTFIISLKGPASNLLLKPELESALEKGKAAQIKALIE